ncbi:zinc ribbon domain-containing protein [Neobacillus cucumis]|uniref:zinc ribbon domain-containing protein n=1 Tax=Neobacillus cucumis TaxID=1740721 RepID=UPI00360EA0F2
MLKNKHLADCVRKQNFYYFRICLEQKCKQTGIELRIVSRFYPSSKLCSCCGHKKVCLSLSERIFICDQCGIEIERDFNASLNLKYAMDYTIIT